MPHSILLTAGDLSGDIHTAALARALLARDSSRQLFALGGARLAEVIAEAPGGRFLGDTTNCSAIGIPSAVRVYFRCCELRAELRKFLRSQRVDVAVLCDWGAFNGHMLPELQAAGIPVLYYFPPRSWQKNGTPGLGIAPYVSRVATPFQWSAERLRTVGCEAEWVGHPLLETVGPGKDRAALRKKFGIGPNEKLIALLPGSRPSEIRILGPRLAKAAKLLGSDRALCFIAVAPAELVAQTRAQFPADIPVLSDGATDLFRAADAAIVKTGTASLEAAVAGTPHVAVYDVSWPTRIEWCLFWAWRRIPFLAMPNIILDREVVPELIGPKCQPKRIAAALRRVLDDEETRAGILRDYALIRAALGSELPLSATTRTAQIVEEMLSQTPKAAS